MKIRCVLNNKVSSFEFYFDLQKKDYLQKILGLYEIREVYLCVYGSKSKDLESKLKKIAIKNFSPISSNSSRDFAFQIVVNKLSELLSMIKNEFDEIIVWNCSINWEQFINEQLEDSFFTLRKTQEISDLGFMLNFSPNDDNHVLIITDLMYHNTKSINKNHINNILCCKE